MQSHAVDVRERWGLKEKKKTKPHLARLKEVRFMPAHMLVDMIARCARLEDMCFIPTYTLVNMTARCARQLV